jgi:two-component system nitrogen regulation response regulator NtrX
MRRNKNYYNPTIEVTPMLNQKTPFIGRSRAFHQIATIVARVADAQCCVCITGESGTGKELVARMLHQHSLRHDKAFVAVNCAALPENLVESELFGHERGAFTGATNMRIGKFEQADGGVLFLDEIADLSLRSQAKILRVMQDQYIERLGSETGRKVDVRIIAATNKNLREMISQNTFREDLYYRLRVVTIHLPPLRERREDILMLAEHFMQEFCAAYGKKPFRFAQDAEQAIVRHDWPGNVRELRNCIERMVVMEEDHSETNHPISRNQIREYLMDDLPLQTETSMPVIFRPSSPERPTLNSAMKRFEKEYVRMVLDEHAGNISAAAEAIGVGRNSIYRKLKGSDERVDCCIV